MLDLVSEPVLLALFGLLGGAVLGLAARLGRFCTLGAIEDILYQDSSVRMRMWGVAIGVAGMATFAMSGLGFVDLSQTIYAQSPFSPIAAVVGGLLFGYGMSLAGSCGFGALARFGGGDMRSFVIVLVMGVCAYVMLSGPLAGLRVQLVEATNTMPEARDYASLLASLIGLPAALCGLALSGAILLFSISDKTFLTSRRSVFWAMMVGFAIASGWAGSAWVARHGFADTGLVSHTFSAPIGETMLFLMTSSAGGLSFGVGSVFGVLLGAFAGSVLKGHFRWEACEDPRELKRQILGAMFMGFGAVLALGCTIGQGLSAFSTLSLSAPLVFVSIFAGAAFGLRQLIVGFSPST